jgi:hypothetical protein
MSFGYSVSDFITVTKLIADLIGALRESGGSKSDYQEIINELEGLDRAIRPLEESTDDASPEIYGLKCAAASCRAILEDFHNKVKKYNSGLGHNASDGMLLKSWKKVRWLGKKEYIDRLRQYLEVHQGNITIMLTERNMAKISLIEKKQSEVTEAVKATKEKVTNAAKEVGAQSALIAAGGSILRRLYYLLNGDIKTTLMEIASYTRKTFVSTQRISTSIIQIQAQLSQFDMHWTYLQAEARIEDPFGNPFRVPSDWTIDCLKAHIKYRFSKGAGREEISQGLYELDHRHNRCLTLNLDDEDERLRARQNLIMSIILVGGVSKSTACPIPTCRSENTEADKTGRRECKNCSVRFDQSSKEYLQPRFEPIPRKRGIEEVVDEKELPTLHKKVRTSEQKSSAADSTKQSRNHLFRNVKIPKADSVPSQFQGQIHQQTSSFENILPRLTTNEASIQPILSLSRQTAAQAPQEQTPLSPPIYFHHWVPPTSSRQTAAQAPQEQTLSSPIYFHHWVPPTA